MTLVQSFSGICQGPKRLGGNYFVTQVIFGTSWSLKLISYAPTKLDSVTFQGYFWILFLTKPLFFCLIVSVVDVNLNFLFEQHLSCLIGQYLLLPRLPPPCPEDTSNQLYRDFTRGQQAWISPGCYEHDPWLLSQEIKGKQDRKNFQDVLFPTRQLKTVVTGLNPNSKLSALQVLFFGLRSFQNSTLWLVDSYGFERAWKMILMVVVVYFYFKNKQQRRSMM